MSQQIVSLHAVKMSGILIFHIKTMQLTYHYSFKHGFTIEKYLISIKTVKFRQLLSRFRLSAHNLNIEVGRWTNIPTDSRLCSLCTLGLVEDEYHLMFICPTYHHFRETYLPEHLYTFPSRAKFSFLMSSRNSVILINLSKFLFYSLKLRNSLIADH